MRYHNITKNDMLNGDGLRVVLWVSGCNHCSVKSVITRLHGTLTEDWNLTPLQRKNFLRSWEKSYINGITFSGGDPLHINNVYEITDLAKEIRRNFHIKPFGFTQDLCGKVLKIWN